MTSQPPVDPFRKDPWSAPDASASPWGGEDPNDPYRYGAPEPSQPAYPAQPAPAWPTQPQQPQQPAQPYGPPQQGYPSYPAGPAHTQFQQPTGSNGKAIAGLVLGILALVLFFIPFFDFILCILGIVFSLLGIKAANRGRPGKGQAVAGFVCAILGTIGCVAISVFAVNRYLDCRDEIVGTVAYDNCVSNRD